MINTGVIFWVWNECFCNEPMNKIAIAFAVNRQINYLISTTS